MRMPSGILLLHKSYWLARVPRKTGFIIGEWGWSYKSLLLFTSLNLSLKYKISCSSLCLVILLMKLLVFFFVIKNKATDDYDDHKRCSHL